MKLQVNPRGQGSDRPSSRERMGREEVRDPGKMEEERAPVQKREQEIFGADHSELKTIAAHVKGREIGGRKARANKRVVRSGHQIEKWEKKGVCCSGRK